MTTTLRVCENYYAVSRLKDVATLGNVVKTQRKKLGLSQVQLGERAGVSQQTIGKIENDRTNKPQNLPNLARALNMKVEELLAQVDEPVRAQTTKQTKPNRKGRSHWPFNFDYSLFDKLLPEQKIEIEADLLKKILTFGIRTEISGTLAESERSELHRRRRGSDTK